MKISLQKIILIFIFSAVAILSYSQSVDVTWGKVSRLEKKGTDFNILGETKGGIFVIKQDKKKNRYIERYDLVSLEHDFTREIEFSKKKGSESKKDKIELEDIFLLDDAIVVFGTSYDKKQKQFNLLVRKYGLDGKPETKWDKIETIQGKRKGNKGGFTIKPSEDKKLFLIEQTNPVKDKEPVSFNFSIYDENLNKVYEKENVKFRLLEDDASLSNHTIKDNTVYFIGYTTTGCTLYSFGFGPASTDGEKIRDYEININKDIRINNAAFSFDEAGDILIAGFYSNKEESREATDLAGTYFVRLNPATFEAKTKNSNPFEKEFLTNFASEKQIRKGKTGIPVSFAMRHFITHKDGSITLLAENSFEVEHCSNSNGVGVAPGITLSAQTCYYTYHKNEVIITRINPDGSVKYAQAIKKAGYSRNPYDNAISYTVIPTEENLYVFYNDHYKSYRPGDTKIRSLPAYKKRVLAVATINSNGEMVKEAMIRHKDIKLEILPRNAIRTESGLIMFGYYKKTVKLGRFTLTQN